jgi:EAL domain-containing protein (putative c-di-GMP-specific phosphodiesterase class I)
VLGRACAQVRAWRDLNLPPVRMAVNASPMEFQQEGFAEQLLRAIGRHGILPSDLEIEITETALMENLQAATVAMRALHNAGVHFAIDDFGIGYSSLSYLNTLPVDVVKIDRSFIEGMTASPQQGALLAGIIAMAHGMGLRVCGEGVETRDQLEALRGWGCDEVQGFLLGRPLPEPEATAAIRRNVETFGGGAAAAPVGWAGRLRASWPRGGRAARAGSGLPSADRQEPPRTRAG